jgi:hypothetical protein
MPKNLRNILVLAYKSVHQNFKTIIFIAAQAINTLATAKNTSISDLIRHKHRQHPRIAIHMVPCDLAAGEETYQRDVAQGFADDL